MSKAPAKPPVSEDRAKKQAKNLSHALEVDTGEKVPLSKALDYIAQIYNYSNWRAMSAAYKPEPLEVHPDNFALMESDIFFTLIQDIQKGIIPTAKRFFAEAQFHIDEFFNKLPGSQSDYCDEIGQHLWPTQWAEKIAKTCGVETIEEALDEWTDEKSVAWQAEHGRKHMLHPVKCESASHWRSNGTASDCAGYASRIGTGDHKLCLWAYYENEALSNESLKVATDCLVEHLVSEARAWTIQTPEDLIAKIESYVDEMDATLPLAHLTEIESINIRLQEIGMNTVPYDRIMEKGFEPIAHLKDMAAWHVQQQFLEAMDEESLEEIFEQPPRY